MIILAFYNMDKKQIEKASEIVNQIKDIDRCLDWRERRSAYDRYNYFEFTASRFDAEKLARLEALLKVFKDEYEQELKKGLCQ